KPVLAGEDEAARTETRNTAGWVLDNLLLLLHPFMPFITEELAQSRGRNEMLILSGWPGFDRGLADLAVAAEIDWMIRLVSEIRALRAEMNVPPGARIPALLQDASAETLRRLDIHRDTILRLARLSEIGPVSGAAPAGAVQLVV